MHACDGLTFKMLPVFIPSLSFTNCQDANDYSNGNRVGYSLDHHGKFSCKGFYFACIKEIKGESR